MYCYCFHLTELLSAMFFSESLYPLNVVLQGIRQCAALHNILRLSVISVAKDVQKGDIFVQLLTFLTSCCCTTMFVIIYQIFFSLYRQILREKLR